MHFKNSHYDMCGLPSFVEKINNHHKGAMFTIKHPKIKRYACKA
jgi:hypothetical protein